MKINFTYNKEKDIWCLLNKGKSSDNSKNPTEQYKELVLRYGENPTKEEVEVFVDEYIFENQIDILKQIKGLENDWEYISSEFQMRAENIFGISLPIDIKAYLTVNSRCPYSISDNFFYISLPSTKAIKTIMHELWHFYTWYGLGKDQEKKLGKEKYNIIKEALTVLINIECKDLLPKGVTDTGYFEHQEMRQQILDLWVKDKNIHNIWNYLLVEVNKK